MNIEQRARAKYGKDETWQVSHIRIENGHAIFRLSLSEEEYFHGHLILEEAVA